MPKTSEIQVKNRCKSDVFWPITYHRTLAVTATTLIASTRPLSRQRTEEAKGLETPGMCQQEEAMWVLNQYLRMKEVAMCLRREHESTEPST